MHGHSFAVVAMGYETDIDIDVEDLTLEYLKEKGLLQQNIQNPVRKDTVLVPCK